MNGKYRYTEILNARSYSSWEPLKSSAGNGFNSFRKGHHLPKYLPDRSDCYASPWAFKCLRRRLMVSPWCELLVYIYIYIYIYGDNQCHLVGKPRHASLGQGRYGSINAGIS